MNMHMECQRYFRELICSRLANTHRSHLNKKTLCYKQSVENTVDGNKGKSPYETCISITIIDVISCIVQVRIVTYTYTCTRLNLNPKP